VLSAAADHKHLKTMLGGIDFGALGADLLDDLMEVEADPLDCGDRYEIDALLGEGGQGSVYRAHDKTLARSVAIKMSRRLETNRFILEEAKILSQLSHPSIPRIYDQGTTPDGRVFVVMQFIAGCRFNEALVEGGLNLAQRLRLVRSLSGALQHAHQAGILHRDLKPENILVTADGEPYVLDWGLAAAGNQRTICGSPLFAAPEQLDGQPAGPMADIYALGLLIYMAATGGELPFERQISFQEFRQRRGRIPRIGMRQRQANLPIALERVYETASSTSAAGRYRDVAALCEALDALELPAAMRARRRLIAAWSGSVAAAMLLGMALGPGRLSSLPLPPGLLSTAQDERGSEAYPSQEGAQTAGKPNTASTQAGQADVAQVTGGQAPGPQADALSVAVTPLPGAVPSAGGGDDVWPEVPGKEAPSKEAPKATEPGDAQAVSGLGEPQVGPVGGVDSDDATDLATLRDAATTAPAPTGLNGGTGEQGVSPEATPDAAANSGRPVQADQMVELPQAATTSAPSSAEPATASLLQSLPPTLDDLPLVLPDAAGFSDSSAADALPNVSLPAIAQWPEVHAAHLEPLPLAPLPQLPPADGWHDAADE
jgi:predicted Ser/Thr protein kinase